EDVADPSPVAFGLALVRITHRSLLSKRKWPLTPVVVLRVPRGPPRAPDDTRPSRGLLSRPQRARSPNGSPISAPRLAVTTSTIACTTSEPRVPSPSSSKLAAAQTGVSSEGSAGAPHGLCSRCGGGRLAQVGSRRSVAYGRCCGIFGLGAWESHVGAPSASTRRCPSVAPLSSSSNEVPTSPPRTTRPSLVSTTTTWCPSVCPGAGSRRIPGSTSASPSCSTYVAPSKSTHSRIV